MFFLWCSFFVILCVFCAHAHPPMRCVGVVLVVWWHSDVPLTPKQQQHSYNRLTVNRPMYFPALRSQNGPTPKKDYENKKMKENGPTKEKFIDRYAANDARHDHCSGDHYSIPALLLVCSVYIFRAAPQQYQCPLILIDIHESDFRLFFQRSEKEGERMRRDEDECDGSIFEL